MVRTIGNPLSWTTSGAAGTARHVAASIGKIGGDDRVTPDVLPLTTRDIRDALRKGVDDFGAVRSDVMFICLLYPVIGAMLVALAFNMNLLHVVFPVAAGFALLGPAAAVGLYEVSRQREEGREASWLTAFDVLGSPNFAAIVALGLYVAALFLAWIVIAHAIWLVTLGPVPQDTPGDFLRQVFTTGAGWAMLVLGMAVGFCFALAVLATGAMSFPLLLDRSVGVPTALATSWKVFLANPRVMLTWGFVVAALLVVGSIPFFLGLIIVFPVLGHATWHLYRKAVRIGPAVPVENAYSEKPL